LVKSADYPVSDGDTSKKKLDEPSDLTLGGMDLKAGRGKTGECSSVYNHKRMLLCIT
jgi:hypothetical protein